MQIMQLNMKVLRIFLHYFPRAAGAGVAVLSLAYPITEALSWYQPFGWYYPPRVINVFAEMRRRALMRQRAIAARAAAQAQQNRLLQQKVNRVWHQEETEFQKLARDLGSISMKPGFTGFSSSEMDRWDSSDSNSSSKKGGGLSTSGIASLSPIEQNQLAELGKRMEKSQKEVEKINKTIFSTYGSNDGKVALAPLKQHVSAIQTELDICWKVRREIPKLAKEAVKEALSKLEQHVDKITLLSKETIPLLKKGLKSYFRKASGTIENEIKEVLNENQDIKKRWKIAKETMALYFTDLDAAVDPEKIAQIQTQLDKSLLDMTMIKGSAGL